MQRRIAGAAEAGIHAGTERARRAEFLGTWVWIGVTTTLVLPVARLVVLLWGVHALAAAGGGAALDVFVRPLPSSPGAYGGCAPLMAAVMAYYFAVVAAIMLVVVAGLAGLLATCAARACCPARRGARGSPPEPDPERVPLTSAAVGEGGVDHKTS